MKYFLLTLFSFAIFVWTSCRKDPSLENDLLYAEEGEEKSGGELTVYDDTPNAFGHQIPGLSTQQGLDFFTGNSFFNQNWVTAPSITTARDGLGPLFNSRSCAGCHFRDGRGRPPSPGEFGTGFLVRTSISGIGLHNEPVPENSYGGQLQDQAILGVDPEVTITINELLVNGNYPDGTVYQLLQPDYQFSQWKYGNPDPAIRYSPRVAQQMIGLGLLEIIPESQILEREDETDVDGNGISGKANYVWNYRTLQSELGRFGWKANQPDLFQQTAGAFLGDMGITTSLFINENCTSAEIDCAAAPNGGTPEIDDLDLNKVVLYCRSLAVPARRNWSDQSVLRGKNLFVQIGCEDCHKMDFTTGISVDIPVLSLQKIHPYSDLLLHDMGPGLADGRNDFLASGTEWRTQPLWGIGLIEIVNGHSRLLHDGRARSIEEAILWHGGEAQLSNTKFKQLTLSQREDVLNFIRSL